MRKCSHVGLQRLRLVASRFNVATPDSRLFQSSVPFTPPASTEVHPRKEPDTTTIRPTCTQFGEALSRRVDSGANVRCLSVRSLGKGHCATGRYRGRPSTKSWRLVAEASDVQMVSRFCAWACNRYPSLNRHQHVLRLNLNSYAAYCSSSLFLLCFATLLASRWCQNVHR
jgi:hypothetical protein